jgi:high-affinity nickel-transport protein
MISLFSIVAIGFFLGMRHATDADHVIAVSTIVSRQQSPWRAALIGGVWGIGHTLTIFIVGTAIILFNLVIPARLGLTMELTVGFMLIALGSWNVSSFLRARPSARIHSHAHAHGDYVHTHPHGHAPEAHTHTPEQTPLAWLDRRLANLAAYQLIRPLIVGVVHGLAGSAAVALLVLASIPNPRWAIAYLLVFGAGTIAGMTLITISMMSAFAYAGARSKWFTQRLAMASGLISLAFGLFLTYQIFFVKGLLTNHPQWTPH